MSDDDLIRRGDAVAKANDGVLKYLHEEFETPPEAYIREAIAALPAADPLSDPRVLALVATMRKMHEGWANALEHGLIPDRHRTSAEILRNDAAAALTAIQEAKQ